MQQLMDAQTRIKAEVQRLADTIQSGLQLARTVRADVDAVTENESSGLQSGKGRLSHPPAREITLSLTVGGNPLTAGEYEFTPDTGEVALLVEEPPAGVVASYTHTGLVTELLQLSTVVSDVVPTQLAEAEARYGAVLAWMTENLLTPAVSPIRAPARTVKAAKKGKANRG